MQPENKNDSVQLPTRYEQYCFAKRHIRGTSRPKVFPIGENYASDNEQDKLRAGRKLLQGNNIKRFQGEKETTAGQPSGQSASKGGNITDNTDSRGGQTHPTNFRIRRLTPTECERLQGFPVGWTEGVSDTRRYQTLGNAVSVPVIKAIMESLLKTLNIK